MQMNDTSAANEKRAVALVLIIALISVFLIITLHARGDDSESNMFINDELWENRAQYPFVDIMGEIYIPCVYLSQISGVEIRESTTLNNLLVSYGGKYLTFDLNNSIMYTSDGSRSEVVVYLLYSSENYIPAKKVCDYLGIKYENSKGCIRISDSSARKKFSALINEYNTDDTEQTTKKEEITTPAVIDDKTREIYLMFDAGEFTPEIADILSQHEICATFVYRYDDVTAKYTEIADLITRKNNIALYADISKSNEEILPVLQAAGGFLHHTLHTSCLLYTTDYGHIRLFNSEKERIDRLGENIFDFVPYDYYVNFVARTRASTAERYIEQYISTQEKCVLYFPDDQLSVGILPLLAEFVGKNSNMVFRQINECDIPDVYMK